MNFRHTKIARILQSFLEYLPDRLYLMVYPNLLELINKGRQGNKVNFKKISENFLAAVDPDLGEFYFYEKTRLEFYCWPDGVGNRLKSIAKKYQSDTVYVEPGDVVIDVGANVGEFSISIHEIAATCFAFEPDPVAYKCLEANALKKANIKTFKSALSDKAGEMIFYLAAKTADSSLVEPMVPHIKSTINVHKLDDLFPSLGVGSIDFLKVEAEGWEPEVLRGAKMILMTKVRKVAVDAGPERQGKATGTDVSAILHECGFKVSLQGDIVLGIK